MQNTGVLRTRICPIGKRVGLTCTTLVALALAMGLVNVYSGRKMAASLHEITTDSWAGVEQLTAIQALALEFRGTSLLMGPLGLSTAYKTKQIAHLDELEQQIQILLQKYESAATSPEERPLYEKLQKETRAFLVTCAHFRQLSLDGKTQEAGAFWSDRGGTQSKAFRKAMQDEVDFNKAGLVRHVDEGVAVSHSANILVWALLAVCVSLGSVLKSAS